MDQNIQTPNPAPVINSDPFKPAGAKKFGNKWVWVTVGAVVVLAAAVGLMLAFGKLPGFSKLGVDVASAEGTVEYRTSADSGWLAVPADLSLSEGAEVRTLASSRAILNIDDGSAIRLNAESSVKLTTLDADHIVVENTGGDVYTRVVKSDTRKFEVVSGQTTYRSEGTGYRTVKTEDLEGVEVYHSKVTILGLNTDGDVVVEQGERYYVVDKDNPDVAGKVTELSLEAVAADSFMQWNSEEDKKDFNSELGVLFDLKPPALEVSSPAAGLTTEAASVAVKGTTEEGAKVLVNGADVTNTAGAFESSVALVVGANSIKVEAVDGAGNKTVKTIAVTRKAVAATPAPTTTGISLYGTKVDKGGSFSWNLSGVSAGKGFKLVRSTSSSKPVYPGNEAVFIDASARSYTLKLQDGKTYYFRICVYDGDGGCGTYSNYVKLTMPTYTSSEQAPTGSITLSHGSGSTMNWSNTGTAYNGYKLVWDTSTGPVYPGSSAAFQEKTATSGNITSSSGTYYVRICMYYNGGCVNYSNEVTVVIP